MIYRAGMTVRYVDGRKFRYCYAERGVPSSSAPTMIFVHGFSASLDNWLPVIKVLEQFSIYT